MKLIRKTRIPLIIVLSILFFVILGTAFDQLSTPSNRANAIGIVLLVLDGINIYSIVKLIKIKNYETIN